MPNKNWIAPKERESFTGTKGEFEYIGKIKSEVAPSQKPTEELQANQSIVDAEVYQYKSNVIAFIDGR